MTSVAVATDLSSTIKLNDGVIMPLFGLGCYLLEQGAPTENAVAYALQHGYRLIDTAQIYKQVFIKCLHEMPLINTYLGRVTAVTNQFDYN